MTITQALMQPLTLLDLIFGVTVPLFGIAVILAGIWISLVKEDKKDDQ